MTSVVLSFSLRVTLSSRYQVCLRCCAVLYAPYAIGERIPVHFSCTSMACLHPSSNFGAWRTDVYAGYHTPAYCPGDPSRCKDDQTTLHGFSTCRDHVCLLVGSLKNNVASGVNHLPSWGMDILSMIIPPLLCALCMDWHLCCPVLTPAPPMPTHTTVLPATGADESSGPPCCRQEKSPHHTG